MLGKQEIEVGDVVRVTDAGKHYSSYSSWLPLASSERGVYSKHLAIGVKGTVVLRGRHHQQVGELLLGVLVGEGQDVVVIGTAGVELVSKKEVPPTPEVSDLHKVKAFYYGELAKGVPVEEVNKKIQLQVVGGWLDLGGEVEMSVWGGTYRIKPDTTTHKGGEYPTPLTAEEFSGLASVYAVDLSAEEGVLDCTYFPEYALNAVKRGLAHSTEEAALQHAKVLLGDYYIGE